MDDAELIRRMVASIRSQYESIDRPAEAAACSKVLEGIEAGSFRQHLTHDEFVAGGRDETPWTRLEESGLDEEPPTWDELPAGPDNPERPA